MALKPVQPRRPATQQQTTMPTQQRSAPQGGPRQPFQRAAAPAAPARNTVAAPTQPAKARLQPNRMHVAPPPEEQPQNQQETYIVRNVEIFYPKLDPENPAEAFGDYVWDVQVQFDEDRLDEMQLLGKVRQLDNGRYALNFKKKAFKKDGSGARPISVVDIHRQPIDPLRIGNGSVANIKLLLRDYEIRNPQGRVTSKGVARTLQKIQIVDYIPYEPQDDFDFDDEVSPDDTDTEGCDPTAQY